MSVRGTIMLPPSRNFLWAEVFTSPPYIPPRLDSTVIEGMRSEEAGVRYLAKLKALRDRADSIHRLTLRVSDRALSPQDRASAATALGLIRAVSQQSAKALVEMLANESVRPNEPLNEKTSPAALALVRIDIPIVPVLTDTIRTSDNALLRFNCAGVMAIMLGQYAKPWLQDVEASAKTPMEKQRVAQVLKFWGKYCTGEGYYANGGSYGWD